MRLLIDGYNIVAPIAGPRIRRGAAIDPNWLHRERMLLIRRLVKHLPSDTREQTCVVFDASNPPSDRPSQYTYEGIDIRFAVEYPEADDLIEEIIASHPAPKNLMVVSSDHRIRNAAKRRHCETFDSQKWLDDLLDEKTFDPNRCNPTSGAGQGRPRKREAAWQSRSRRDRSMDEGLRIRGLIVGVCSELATKRWVRCQRGENSSRSTQHRKFLSQERN